VGGKFDLCAECHRGQRRHPDKCAVCFNPVDDSKRDLCGSCYQKWKAVQVKPVEYVAPPGKGPAPAPEPAPVSDVRPQPSPVSPMRHSGLTPCEQGEGCRDFSEAHLEHCTHGENPAIERPRKKCTMNPCHNRDPRHLREFVHHPLSFEPGPAINLNTIDVSKHNEDLFQRDEWANFSRYNGLKELVCVDFYGNQADAERKLDSYMAGRGFVFSESHIKEIAQMFLSFRPVHLCSGNVFKSVVSLRYFLSMFDILTIWTDTDALVKAISLNCEVTKKAKEFKVRPAVLNAYLELFVKKCRYGLRSRFTGNFQHFADETPIMTGSDEERLTQSSSNIPDDCRNEINRIATSIIENVVVLLTNDIGINNFTDGRLRLDHIVFSILGMSDANYGESEVAIFFDQSTMSHPDSFFTFTAATGYNGNSDLWYRGGWTIFDRSDWSSPRASRPPTDKDREEGMKNFMKERFSFCTPGWEYLLAKEWICRVNYHTSPNGRTYPSIADGEIAMNDVTPEHIIKCMSMYKERKSHGMTEVHLPSKTPIDAIEEIVIKESVLNSIRDDPSVADFLSYFKNVRVVKSDEEIHEVIRARAKELNYPSVKYTPGFSFSVVSGNGYPDVINIPHHISEKKALISFGITGGSFSFILSSCKNVCSKAQKVDDGVPVKSYLFSVDMMGRKGLLCNKIETGELMKLNPQFNFRIDDDDSDDSYIEYEIVLNYECGLIGISHGPHGDRTNAERGLMKVSDLREMETLRYISFCPASGCDETFVVHNVLFSSL